MLFLQFLSNNRQIVRAIDPDNDESSVIVSELVLGANPTPFEPKLDQSAINPKTFNVQGAVIYSNGELSSFWYHVFFKKRSKATPILVSCENLFHWTI